MSAGGQDAEQSTRLPRRGVGRLVHNCQRAFTIALERRLRRHGISPSHWYHLNELWTEDGLTQVELSAKLGIEKASSSKVLDDLEQAGWISRERMEDDRRKVANHLTEKGREFTAALIDETVALTTQSQQGLSAEELRVFLKVLQTLTANLRNASGPDEPAPK